MNDFLCETIRTIYLPLSEGQKTPIINIRNAIASPTQTLHFGQQAFQHSRDIPRQLTIQRGVAILIPFQNPSINQSIHQPFKDKRKSNFKQIMSEQLCLQWNDFKENVNSAFGRLREDQEFVDVTPMHCSENLMKWIVLH